MVKVFKKCLYCGTYLSGKQRKYCSVECGDNRRGEINRKRYGVIKLKELEIEARWDRIKENSSKRAVKQIRKLMKDEI